MQKGYRVVVHYHTSKDAARVLEKTYGAKIVQGDLSVPEAIEPIFQEALTGYGAIDHVINNASCFSAGTIEELACDEYQRMMNLHVTAPLFLSQALYRHLQRRGRTGSIINIVDTRVSKPTASRVGYYLSKSALLDRRRCWPSPRTDPSGQCRQSERFSPTGMRNTQKMEKILPLGKTGTAGGRRGGSVLLEADFVSGIELRSMGSKAL